LNSLNGKWVGKNERRTDEVSVQEGGYNRSTEATETPTIDTKIRWHRVMCDTDAEGPMENG